jgi:hypothetical protein
MIGFKEPVCILSAIAFILTYPSPFLHKSAQATSMYSTALGFGGTCVYVVRGRISIIQSYPCFPLPSQTQRLSAEPKALHWVIVVRVYMFI